MTSDTEPQDGGAGGPVADPDWAAIRIAYEEETGTSVAAIGRRHAISPHIVIKRALRDGWRPRKARTAVVDRPKIIRRLFRILELQVMDLEQEIDEMHREKRRSGDKEVVVLSKLAGNLDKLMSLDAAAAPVTARRRTKQMEDLRSKLIERIEQLKRQ
jgi:hypothetical protein